MNNENRILRVEIDGNWSVEDMIDSFSCLRDLYNLRLVIQFEYEELRDMRHFYEELSMFTPSRHKLKSRIVREKGVPFLPIEGSTIPFSNKDLRGLDSLFYPEEKVKVRRVRYESPGLKDIAGVGEIVGHVKDFVLAVINLCVDRQKRKHKNEERSLKNDQLRIENAANLLN